MALVTAYKLPFVARAPSRGELGKNDTVYLRIRLNAPPTEAVIVALGATVTAWEVLASTGAMCGDSIPAQDSGITTVTRPIPSAGTLEWTLTGVRLDDRAAVVLMHMLLVDWGQHRFAAVELLPMSQMQSAATLVSDETAWEIYPGLDRTMRFPMRLGPSIMGDAHARVLFSAQPTPQQQDDIRASVLTWAGVTTLGAYAIAPGEPLKCGYEPEQVLEFAVDELVWPLRKFRAHVGAAIGLANVWSAIDRTVLPLRELEIA